MKLAKFLPLISLAIVLAIIGQVLLKLGVQESKALDNITVSKLIQTYSKILFNPRIILGILLYVFSLFIWLYLLSKVELSFAYPFLGMTFIIMAAVSQFVFGEKVSAFRWSGSLIIFLGIFVSSLK